MVRPVIHSVKHYVHTPALGIASGAKNGIDIVDAITQGSSRTNAFDVYEGTTIKAVYVEYWVKADSPNFTVNGALIKLPASIGDPSFTEMNNLGTYENKKNILEVHQGLAPSGDQVLPLFRHWVKIPKGKQRFGLGDRLRLTISFSGSNGDVCGFSTYKEYS